MSSQRISELAEIQEANAIFIALKPGSLAQLTSGSFRPDRLF